MPAFIALLLFAAMTTASAAQEGSDWRERLLERVLSADEVEQAEWITSDILWASVPDIGEPRDGKAAELCRLLGDDDAREQPGVRIQLWDAQQPKLGSGIVLGEAECTPGRAG